MNKHQNHLLHLIHYEIYTYRPKAKCAYPYMLRKTVHCLECNVYLPDKSGKLYHALKASAFPRH
jgi:hypothetical protein